MKLKGLLAILLAVFMVFSVTPVFSARAGARGAETASYTGTYYSDNGYSIDTLLGKSGTALYNDLQTLMTNTHTHVTTYDEIREKIQYSDADPNVSGNILLCYSGASVNGAWDSGVTYNREHVWPKSLGTFNTSNAGGSFDIEVQIDLITHKLCDLNLSFDNAVL